MGLAESQLDWFRRVGQVLVSRSSSFDPQTAAVGIGRAVGTVGIPSAVGIVDGVLGERRAVAVYLVYLVCLVSRVNFVHP